MRTAILCLTGAMVCAGVATPQQPAAAWLPPDEPSPFIPDAARWIGEPPGPAGWTRTIYLRGTVTLPQPPRRAVLCVAPAQTVEVRVNGALVATAHDPLEALPAFAEVGPVLSDGANLIAVKVHSEWRPMLYAQLRVEYADGSWGDFASGEGWQVCAGASEGWRTGADGAGEWVAAVDGGGYYPEGGGGVWGLQFALLPREALRARFAGHNDALRAAWADDQRGPFSEFQGTYEDPALGERFAGFWRLDRATGQLRDAQGRELHPFLTIYNQFRDGGGVMTVPDFDFDQLGRDLDLMARAHVNPYMRNFGWHVLLDAQGRWAELQEQPRGTDLPHFRLVRDVYDYFLDRVQAHGLHVVFEADFYWSAHGAVVPAPYRTRYHLYPEVLDAQALATRKMMNYLSRRTCVLGYMAGEEDIIVAYDLDNPHLAQAYREHLARKYGTVEAFVASHPYGYDYQDLSSYQPTRRPAEYGEGQPQEDVLSPVVPYREGVFREVRDWADIPLPYWPTFRSPEDPQVPLAAHRSYNEFTPDDPLWVDYYETTQEELLFDMLARWARTVREGCPRQLLFYSNAQDFTASWHFLHLFRRSELPFDAIGVGCHDSGIDPQDLEPWATTRKAIKNAASYRPYVRARGALPVGLASGEGEGGKPEHPAAVLDYYRGALFDEIGGGLAWTQTYTWLHMSGGEAGETPHETPLLRWMAEFMPAHEHDPFPLAEDVPVLVVRNENLQHSNRSGLDYGNAISLANYLTQLNIEFDIAMDQALSYGDERPFGIDLSRYRVVLIPALACDLPEGTWAALDAWLSDPAAAGQRTLVVGLSENRSPYLAPRGEFHPVLQQWLGCADYAERADVRGKQALTCARSFGPHEAGERLSLDFGPRQWAPTTRCGFLADRDALLRLDDGRVLAIAREVSGNRVYAFGFFLGLAYSDLWGMDAPQEQYDAPTQLWEAVIAEAGVERPVRAPHNVRVYVSGDGRTVLVRERYCRPTEAVVEVRLPEGVQYAEGERLPDGYTRFRLNLRPYEGLALEAH